MGLTYYGNFYVTFLTNIKKDIFCLLYHILNAFLQSDDISRVARASKIVERMVNQNTFDDVTQGN